jgi:hypothetical protein
MALSSPGDEHSKIWASVASPPQKNFINPSNSFYSARQSFHALELSMRQCQSWWRHLVDTGIRWL